MRMRTSEFQAFFAYTFDISLIHLVQLYICQVFSLFRRLASFPREGWWGTLKNKSHKQSVCNVKMTLITHSLASDCFSHLHWSCLASGESCTIRSTSEFFAHTNQMKIFQLPCKCNIKSQRRQFKNGVVSQGYHRSRQKNFAGQISKRKRLCQTVFIQGTL